MTTILLVDDDQDSREIVGAMLRFKSYHVVEADNGVTACNIAHAVQPSLIIIDIVMPEMSGIEALKWFRADPLFSGLPILCLTAHVIGTIHDEALAAGFNEIVTKPVDPTRLLFVIEQYTRTPADPAETPPG